MNALAEKHPRWGYRSITKLLQNDGWKVNPKRIERLGRLEGHHVHGSKSKNSGRKAAGVGSNSSKNRPALAGNHIWSYDFVSARLRHGSPFRILNVVDEFTRLSLGPKRRSEIMPFSIDALKVTGCCCEPLLMTPRPCRRSLLLNNALGFACKALEWARSRPRMNNRATGYRPECFDRF